MSTNSNSEIHQRAFRNSLIGALSFVFSFIQAIVLVPVLLKYWGNEKYGVWLALYAAFSLLQSLDTGHISYVGNKINITYHTDKSELKKTLSSSFYAAIIIGIVQIFFVIILIVFNYLPDFIGIESTTISKYSINISLLILITFWFISGSIGGILHRIMIPSGFYYQSQWWVILYRFCQFFSILIVALFDGSILIASILYVFIQLIVYGLTFFYIKIKIPEFYPWWQGANLKVGLLNFNKSLFLTFTGFVQQLSSNGLVLIISNIFSSIFLPVFTTIRTMTNTALLITNILINSLVPDFIRYHAEKEKDKLYSVFNANWFFSGLIVNIGLILVIPFAENIFSYWTKGIIKFDFDLFIYLAASISVINFGAGLYNYIYLINNLKAVMAITITRVVVLFGFAFYLSDFMGLGGIGAAVLISELFSSIILTYFFAQKILKTFNGSLDIKTSLTALVPPMIITLLATSNSSGMKFSYLVWTISFILIVIVYIYNWIILDSEVKDRTIMLIHNLIQNKR